MHHALAQHLSAKRRDQEHGSKTQKFLPEQVDEQLERLLAQWSPAKPASYRTHDLRHLYQDDEHSLAQVWRPGLEEKPPTGREEQP
jgi:hypothetical protein